MTDYRALCAELTNELSGYKVANPMHDFFLLNRARAALAAEPEPLVDGDHFDDVPKMVEPADGEVARMVAAMAELAFDVSPYAAEFDTRAADILKRLAPQPVPEELTDRELRDIWFEHSYGDEGFLVMTESMFLTASRIILDRLKLK